MTSIDVMDMTMRMAGPGEDEVPTGKIGVVLSAHGQDVVTIVGTPEQLRKQVLDGFMLPVPEDVPLFDE